MRGRLITALIAACCFAACASAPVAVSHSPAPALFHAMFSDHAVLQRGQPIRIWGQAARGAEVVVLLDASEIRVRAGPDGVWRAELPAHDAGGPYVLSAQAGSVSQALSDVMVGDVYLCSGQSNMEFVTRYATSADSTINAAANANIRLFNVTRRTADTPQAGFQTPHAWSVASSESVADFSAVCYFFGHDIEARAHVPIGLIASSWGGTVIQAWISEPELSALGGYEEPLSLMQQSRADPAAARALCANLERLVARSRSGHARRLGPRQFRRAELADDRPAEFLGRRGHR